MKILFLDIDGCLNSVASFIYNNRLNLAGLTDTKSHESMCPISCSNLQYILEEVPDAQIVITSTWRKYKTLDELKEKFEKNGVSSDRIIGITPFLHSEDRGREIDLYLKNHSDIENFVIIDDDTDLDPYMDRLVKTDGRNGLTFTDAEKAILMLGGKNEKEGS